MHHHFSKSELKYINYRFQQIQENFPEFIAYNVYCKDTFKYVEVHFMGLQQMPKKKKEKAIPWDNVDLPESNRFRIFQIITNKIYSQFPNIIFDIDYKHFKFKAYTQQVFSLIPKKFSLKFIDEDNYIYTNISFINGTTLELKAFNNKKSKLYVLKRHTNYISQLFPIKDQYSLVDINILIDYFLMNMYKKKSGDK